jgi:transcriptional antiterminator RfaH
MPWYAVHTKPQQEAITHRDLVRGGFGAFYPTQRIRRHVRKNGALIARWISRPYFPRWLFVDSAMDSLWRVRQLASVSSLAGAGPEPPVAIPGAVMQVLMAGADVNGIMGSRDEVARQRFEVAARVRVAEGALEGAIGAILRDDGGDLVDVLIRILGGTRTVKVRAETLQLAALVA